MSSLASTSSINNGTGVLPRSSKNSKVPPKSPKQKRLLCMLLIMELRISIVVIFLTIYPIIIFIIVITIISCSTITLTNNKLSIYLSTNIFAVTTLSSVIISRSSNSRYYVSRHYYHRPSNLYIFRVNCFVLLIFSSLNQYLPALHQVPAQA